MQRFPWIAVGLAALLDGALAAALLVPPAGSPLVVAPPGAAPRVPGPALAPGLDRLTADDVARGVWALATGPGLDQAQRATLAPGVLRGHALHARVGELRTAYRAARGHLVASVLTGAP